MKYARLLCALVILVLSLSACDTTTTLTPLHIKPVEPVDSLPTLIEGKVKILYNYQDTITQMQNLKNRIEEIGGQIDIGLNNRELDCQLYFNYYQEAVAMATLQTHSDDPLLVWGVDKYNTAIDHIVNRGRDTYLHCQEHLLGQAANEQVASLSWSLARVGVNESIAMLDEGMTRLRDELPDNTIYIGVGGQILREVRHAMDLLGDMGYELDKQLVNCPVFTEKYAELENLPEFVVSSSDPVLQAAYQEYREAVKQGTQTTHDQYLDCKELLATELAERPIPRLTATMARHGIAEAMNRLHQAQEWLKDYGN